MNNILKMISQMDANANEIKLAKHEVELSGIADKALKSFDSFMNTQLQNTIDLKTQVDDLIKKYNKKVKITVFINGIFFVFICVTVNKIY